MAGSARRIFLCKSIVQGRSRSGLYARQCETPKKLKTKAKVFCTIPSLESSTSLARFARSPQVPAVLVQIDQPYERSVCGFQINNGEFPTLRVNNRKVLPTKLPIAHAKVSLVGATANVRRLGGGDGYLLVFVGPLGDFDGDFFALGVYIDNAENAISGREDCAGF